MRLLRTGTLHQYQWHRLQLLLKGTWFARHNGMLLTQLLVCVRRYHLLAKTLTQLGLPQRTVGQARRLREQQLVS